MDTLAYLWSVAGLLPWYTKIAALILIGLLIFLNYTGLLVRLRITTKKLNKRVLAVISGLILLSSLSSTLPLLVREKKLLEENQKLRRSLNPTVEGLKSEEYTESGKGTFLDCVGWSLCSDFKTDTNLQNKYYRHTSDDPQKLILEGGPFTNPPLYLEKETLPFYTFKLEVQPLDSDAANILVESKDMFQLFIGDNDYRSFAFLVWDKNEALWVRRDDAKIYLGRDLNLPDIEPKTQLTIEISTRKKGYGAEAEFTIVYKSDKGKKEIAHFKKVVDIPAAEPSKFLTKVGTGMFRTKGNIPQAKFYFMGLKQP